MKKIAIPTIFIVGAALAYKLFGFELLDGLMDAVMWFARVVTSWIN